MDLRKFVLLLLPTTVAFLVGGYGGEIFGMTEFFWAGAIGWALIIFIVDYNFTMIEKMSPLGTLGRIVLVVSSALITATVGDHILFKDTIRNRMDKGTGIEISKIKDKPELVDIQKTIEEDKRAAKIQAGKVAKYSDEQVRECRSGKGPKCDNLIRLVSQEDKKLSSINDRIEKNEEKYDAKFAKYEAKAEEAGERHDIIAEIKELYKYIFEEPVATVFFILLSMMVICIETLPLLLKGGKTRASILAKRKQAMWRNMHQNL